MKFAQIVMGPAGAGKSTYCQAIQEWAACNSRTIRIINLDPAAEVFKYTVAHDIRDLISVEDVMDELKLGPNGGLVYCMEYLVRSTDWFEEILEPYGDDDYLVFDCPGQIELYSHIPVMKEVVGVLRRFDFNVAGVYIVDAVSITDASKLLAGTMMALSAMINLELPHVNVMSKIDLVPEGVDIERYLTPEPRSLVDELHETTSTRFRRLNEAFGSLLEDYSMVSFLPLNVHEEESTEVVLMHVDHCIQYGEDLEPRDPGDGMDGDEDGDGGGGGGGGGGGDGAGGGGLMGGAGDGT